MGKVQVVNAKSFKGAGVYIGRSCHGYKGSVLRNRFKIGVDGNRDEVIEKYRRWLWDEFKKGGEVKDDLVRLCGLLKEGKEVVLKCWCVPKRCHGEVVKRCIEWMMK
ncbi:MAG: DUF4326 domain-containing protein [Thermodesulfobacteriota bacterium]